MCKPHKSGKMNDETQVYHEGFGKIRGLAAADQALAEETPRRVTVKRAPKNFGILTKRFDKDGKPKRWFHESKQWYASERSRAEALKQRRKNPKPWTNEVYELIER